MSPYYSKKRKVSDITNIFIGSSSTIIIFLIPIEISFYANSSFEIVVGKFVPNAELFTLLFMKKEVLILLC